ncbi:hypothetical protein REPUB_Repub01dG0166500 [Reevesia pubescens]
MEIDSEDEDSTQDGEGTDDVEDIDITLTKEEKKQIQNRWSSTLIVNVFGKTIGYQHLVYKLKQLWKPQGKLFLIVLGFDFFLVKFLLVNDYDLAIKRDPWFMGGRFLAIRKWVPNFKASTASFSSVVVWVRLPERPIEYYDVGILMKIGKRIRTMLRVDSLTFSRKRGKFTRLCVQVNLDKPLRKFVMVERIKQAIVYEGIDYLCFHCGKIGHKKDYCSGGPLVAPTDSACLDGGHENSDPIQMAEEPIRGMQEDDNYGLWMLVQKRKPNVAGQGENTSDRTPPYKIEVQRHLWAVVHRVNLTTIRIAQSTYEYAVDPTMNYDFTKLFYERQISGGSHARNTTDCIEIPCG